MLRNLFFSTGLAQNASWLTAVIEGAHKCPVCSNFGDVHCDTKESLKASNLPYFFLLLFFNWTGMTFSYCQSRLDLK